MTSQRLAWLAACVLLLLILLSGLWLSQRLLSNLYAPPPAAGPTAAPTLIPPTASPTAVQAPRGYRLAGTALSGTDPFAVIEAPDGTHRLYRLNDEVPELGKLIRIDAERAVIATASGRFTLWVAPAATLTRTHTRRPMTPTPKQTPRRTVAPAGTTVGSTPSVGPGRPAS